MTFTEFFQGREKWESCARWCGRAINLAKGDSKGSTPKRVPHADKAALLLASLLTLRGEFSQPPRLSGFWVPVADLGLPVLGDH